MHLGFHYHVPAYRKDGQIYIPGYLGRFIDSLAPHLTQLSCFLHTPNPSEVELMDYRIESPNVRLVGLGLHDSLPRRVMRSKKIRRVFAAELPALDMFLFRAPTPLLPFLAKECGNLPLALLLVGDQLSVIDDLPQPFWRRELIRFFWQWNAAQQNRVAEKGLFFVNSNQLALRAKAKGQNPVEIRTTTLRQSDFFERKDTCLHPPYHILYVGRIEKTKGVFDLLDAFIGLIKRGYDLQLDLVGWAVTGDTSVEDLLAAAKENGVAERVLFHGYKALGEQLFAMYRQADIYVMPSHAEGFPRTIWEALAHSLPVVATRVGSIPAYIEGAAELVDPKDVDALVKAVEKLLSDPSLRQKYIQDGMRLAHENTLEVQSAKMIEEMKAWLSK